MDESQQTPTRVTGIQTWTVTITSFDDGHCTMDRTNDGFNALELWALADYLKKDIIQQFDGIIKPDIVKRTFIKD